MDTLKQHIYWKYTSLKKTSKLQNRLYTTEFTVVSNWNEHYRQ